MLVAIVLLHVEAIALSDVIVNNHFINLALLLSNSYSPVRLAFLLGVRVDVGFVGGSNTGCCIDEAACSSALAICVCWPC